MGGMKKVEFRKTNVPTSITHVVVYATSPEKKVVGYFSVDEVVKASPATLWERFGSAGMIDETPFFGYYAGQQYGLGILVGQVLELERPFTFTARNGDLSVPQSFSYFNGRDWRNLKRRKKTKKGC